MSRLISFDYAIKYLLKHKSDYDIIEGFISALLQIKGYKPIKIKALLESESNKEDKKGKASVADLVVGDEGGTKYIIEIERNEKLTFFNKACFNTSRLVVDSISQSIDYSSIAKIFHVSILYFQIGDSNSSLYHGKTILHDIDNENTKTAIHIEDQNGKQYDITDVMPEYFIISIPAFKDKIKRDIDEWVYMMKHEEIKPDFKAPSIKKAAERLTYLKMSKEERCEHDRFLIQQIDYREEMNAAIIRSKIEGKIEGKIEIARKMLLKKLSIDEISEMTGLTIKEIKKLV